MPDYFVFGGCLRSELPFPELAPAHGVPPTWTLHLGALAEIGESDLLADLTLSPSCRMRVARVGDRHRYSHSCTGTFEVSADGRTILFEPRAGADLNVARTDLVARVLLLCVDQDSVAWLHGSAVAIGGRAVAFLGPSGAGKSTMSLALARAGALHVCDDTLPVEIGDEIVVWPSDHTLRLRDDSRALLARSAPAVRRDSDGKFVLTHESLDAHGAVPRSAAENARFPLDALYLLGPALGPDDPGVAMMRRRLAPVAAVTSLMPHLKLGPVVRDGAPAKALRQLGSLAGRLPVYELRVTREWARLDDAVTQMLTWHGGNDVALARRPSAEVLA